MHMCAHAHRDTYTHPKDVRPQDLRIQYTVLGYMAEGSQVMEERKDVNQLT